MAKVKHLKRTYKTHAWVRNSDKTIDHFGFASGFCNGPLCKRCSFSFCEHCYPDGWKDSPCVVEKWECPKCHQKLCFNKANFCSNCGEKLEWQEE